MLQSKAGHIDVRRPPPFRRIFSQRTAGPYKVVSSSSVKKSQAVDWNPETAFCRNWFCWKAGFWIGIPCKLDL